LRYPTIAFSAFSAAHKIAFQAAIFFLHRIASHRIDFLGFSRALFRSQRLEVAHMGLQRLASAREMGLCDGVSGTLLFLLSISRVFPFFAFVIP
jgi:hypothetical protein